jgi:hypothetical protein
VLYFFTGGADGGAPDVVTIGPDGVLYGVTWEGGRSSPFVRQSGPGVFFSLTPPSAAGGAWTETVLCEFRFAGGAKPSDPLILGKDGVLYGTASKGGQPCLHHRRGGCGVVFALQPPKTSGGVWKETVLHKFDGKDGAEPWGGLAMDDKGDLYGTTFRIPSTVFRLTRQPNSAR